MTTISTIPALEACLGEPSTGVLLKVIDHLDPGAQRWLGASPIGFLAFARDGSIQVTTGGGAPGFAHADGENILRVPVALVDDQTLARPGDGFGSLFLVPGVGETLRINGRVIEADDSENLIAVDECYMHCAKALIRSGFWTALATDDAPHDTADFLSAARFLALATLDNSGRADVSPKGDPAGAMVRFVDGVAHYAERPGNRRADSYRNMIVNPQMAAIAIVPGSSNVVRFGGRAKISDDASLRELFVVQGKSPLLVTAIDDLSAEVVTSDALGRAALWPTGDAPAEINPAKMLVEHINRNKTTGVKAALVRASVAIPGTLEKGLESDYKNNLY